MTTFESHSRFRENLHRSDDAVNAENDVNRALFQPLGTSCLNLHRLLTNGLTDLCLTKHTGVQALRTLANWLDNNNPMKLVYQAPPAGSAIPLAPQTVPAGTAKTATHHDMIPIRSQPRVNPPRVTYLLGGRMTGAHEIAKRMADELGYTPIIISDLLKTKGGDHAAKVIREGGLVEASIVCPLVIDELLQHPNATDFVIVGGPRSLKQLHFIEHSFPSVSRLVYLQYSRNDLLQLGLIFGRSERIPLETAASSFFTAEQDAVFKAFGDRLFAVDLEISSIESDYSKVVERTWAKVGEIVKPEISIVFGFPGSGLTTLANRLASTQPGNLFFGDLSTTELIAAAQSSPHFRIVIEADIPINWNIQNNFTIRDWIHLVPKDDAAKSAARARSSRAGDLKIPGFDHPDIRVIEFSAETTPEEIFNRVMQGRRPQTILVTGVPFSGVTEHSQLIGMCSGYPVVSWVEGDSTAAVFEKCNKFRSPVVIIDNVPAQSVRDFDPSVVVIFSAEKIPIEDRTAKAAAWHEERGIDFNAEAFVASSESINSALLEISSLPATVIKDSVDTSFLLPMVYFVEGLEIPSRNFQVIEGVKPEAVADAIKAEARKNILGTKFIVKNSLAQIIPNTYPAIRDVLDSLEGVCNFLGVAAHGSIAEVVKNMGFKILSADEIV